MNDMNNQLDTLIEQGKIFNFGNNSCQSYSEMYSKASDEFLAWVARVEHYVIQNYDGDSGPVKLLNTVDKNKFSGYYQSDFDKQINILRGVLISCKEIQPTKQKKREDNPILILIKSPLFWTVIGVLIGGSFTLGFNFGNTKFDKDLIELTQTKKDLQDSIKAKEKIIQNLRHNSDSALNILGDMPYKEMQLDTLEFRKVQTTLENAGAVLYLNK